MSQIENRLAAFEDRVLKLELAADMASRREQALMQVLGWLLANCPNQDAPGYLIDRLDQKEQLEPNPGLLESIVVYEQLLEDVGQWYSLRQQTG